VDALTTLIFFRGCERLLIVACALALLGMGVFLFKIGVSGAASLVARHDKFHFQLANASPGLFCFLFGAAVLICSLDKQLVYSHDTNQLSQSRDVTSGATFRYSDKQREKVEQLVKALHDRTADELAKDKEVLTNVKKLADEIQSEK
jgi:hypothetical protein